MVMSDINLSLGDYLFSFEPPLDARTEGMDLVDAVALQISINKSEFDMCEDYLTNPHIIYMRERSESEVGHFLFYVIDGGDPKKPNTEENKIAVMKKYLGSVTGREVTVSKNIQ